MSRRSLNNHKKLTLEDEEEEEMHSMVRFFDGKP